MSKLLLKPLTVAVPVLAPVIGLGNAMVRIGTATSTGPMGGVIIGSMIITEECTPPAVYYSGKCITAFVCYASGIATCNPAWFGAGTTILTSILHYVER